MFIAALSTIAKTWKEPKCPSPDKWIKKMWYIYTMEYYTAMRKNEIWPFVAKWMDLEGVMLCEIASTNTGEAKPSLLLACCKRKQIPAAQERMATETARSRREKGKKRVNRDFLVDRCKYSAPF